MVEMVILQTIHTKELKIEDIPITQHHLDHHIQIVTSEAFTIEDQPGQVIGFTALIHMSTSLMFHTSRTTASNLETPPHARSMVYQGNLLSPIVIEQTIIQAAFASIKCLMGEKVNLRLGWNAWKMLHKYQVKIHYTKLSLN